MHPVPSSPGFESIQATFAACLSALQAYTEDPGSAEAGRALRASRVAAARHLASLAGRSPEAAALKPALDLQPHRHRVQPHVFAGDAGDE